MSLEAFLANLDPKTAARVKTAQDTEITRLPLASYGLTKALNGGIAKGRITLAYGNQSAGKSLVFEESIGRIWQPDGLVCAWVDVEGTYDKDFGAKLGIDNDEMILIRSQSSGRIENEIRPLLENKIDVIIIDSISFILPEAFIGKDGSMNDQEGRKQMGAQAKAITNLINGIHYLNEDTAVVLISQTTTEIGQTYVKQVPHGGKKVLFAASQIIKLTSSNTDANQIKGDVQVGDLLVQEPVDARWTSWSRRTSWVHSPVVVNTICIMLARVLALTGLARSSTRLRSTRSSSRRGAWYNWEGQQWQGAANTTQYFKGQSRVLGVA